MRLLALDPSVNDVGWATFDTSEIKVGHQYLLKNIDRLRKIAIRQVWKWGTWHLEGTSLEMRQLDLVQTIIANIGPFDILIGEKPSFFDNARGHIASRQNYTIDLAAVLNYVAGWFHKDHRNYFPINVMAWKGNVPKMVTARQFFRIFGYKERIPPAGLTDHAIDATMLLHYWLKTYGLHSRLIAQDIGPELLKLLC